MATPEPSFDARRSTRLTLAIPVEVSGRDVNGKETLEKVATKLVNKHGACIVLDSCFDVGSRVTLRVPHLDRQQRCRVAWVTEQTDGGGRYETGLELESAENFWGIQFPPEDWTQPKGVPLAGDPAESAFSEQRRSPDPQWLSAMLNALVEVLEEKGILNRAELSEKIKRMS